MPSTVPKPGRKYKAIGDHCTSDPHNLVNQVNRRYIVTLALAATAILVVGSLLRPQPITTDEPVPRP